MVLNIVKNSMDISYIFNCIKNTFDNSKVSIKKDYGISVDIEVIDGNGIHSLEGLKELESYFKECDIRIW